MMRVLFWYCETFAWQPAIKTLATVPDAESGEFHQVIVAFIQVEPDDVLDNSSAEKKLLKNIKWLAAKWQNKNVILHSFTHLGDQLAEPGEAQALFNRVDERLKKVGYGVKQTPYGYFLDLSMQAKGHPLARIYKEF